MEKLGGSQVLFVCRQLENHVSFAPVHYGHSRLTPCDIRCAGRQPLIIMYPSWTYLKASTTRCNPNSNTERAFCVPAVNNTNKSPIAIQTEGFNLADYSGVYPLLKGICSYLPYKELQIIGEASVQWRDVADDERAKRKCCSWISVKRIRSKVNLVQSTNFEYMQKSVGFLLIYYFDKTLLNKFVCIHVGNTKLRKTFQEYIYEVARLKDMVCVCLRSMYSISKIQEDWTFLERPIFTTFYLPEIPGIRIHQFYYVGIPAEDSNVFREVIAPYEFVECILVLGTTNLARRMMEMLQQLEEMQSIEDTTIGGGLVWSLKSGRPDVQTEALHSSDLYCISFLSNALVPNKFFSASIVVRAYLFEEQIQEFKLTLKLYKQSVMFRFCCFGKQAAEDEDPILQKHFPHTPLVQFDVSGEIGYDPDDELRKYLKKTEKKFFHQFCTVLMFLSWENV